MKCNFPTKDFYTSKMFLLFFNFFPFLLSPEMFISFHVAHRAPLLIKNKLKIQKRRAQRRKTFSISYKFHLHGWLIFNIELQCAAVFVYLCLKSMQKTAIKVLICNYTEQHQVQIFRLSKKFKLNLVKLKWGLRGEGRQL